MICFLDTATETSIATTLPSRRENDLSSHNEHGSRPEKEGLVYYDFEQGSQAWIDLRNKFITASAIGSIVRGTKGVEYQNLVAEKASCGEYRSFFGNVATRWGHKYEPVADMLYEYRNPGVKIYEYGLVNNPKYPELAVSPDGITSSGEMLEIKCPYSRRIDGKIKYEYAQQMQQQLLVCEYEVCNFLECKFVEVEKDRFWELFPLKTCEKGIIIQSLEKGEKYNYYSPIELSHNIEHLKLWYQYRIEDIEREGGEVVKETYWLLDRYLCQKVKRDPNWYEQNKQSICEFWEDVNRARVEGWERLLKKSTEDDNTVNDNMVCLLDNTDNNTVCLLDTTENNTICLLDTISRPVSMQRPVTQRPVTQRVPKHNTAYFSRLCEKKTPVCYI